VFIRPERSAVVRLVAVLWQLRTELAVTAVVVWCWLWLTPDPADPGAPARSAGTAAT
jgi:hypothetical protein